MLKCIGTQTPEPFSKLIQIKSENTHQEQLKTECENENSDIYFTEQSKENLLQENSNMQNCKMKEKNVFKCGDCNFECLEKIDWMKHFKEHLNNCERVRHQCIKCNFQSRSQRLMSKHMNIHGVQKLNVCKICNISFPSKKLREKHILNEHVGSEKYYACPFCKFECKGKYKKLINKHIDHHSANGSLSCEICRYKYSSKYVKNNHMNNFSCEYCNNSFTYKQTMKHHMIHNHLGNYKKYLCSLCDFQCKFTSKILINNHKYKHSHNQGRVFYPTKEEEFMQAPKNKMEKNISCPVCDVKLALKSSMKKHLMIHSGERPFTCFECMATFRQKGHLKAHISIHTKEKPFGCSMCNYRSINTSLIRRHMISHSKAKFYNCAICNGNFKRRHKLVEHFKKFHSQN
ncbi:unnamed protein product, partial [Meganyctiphanes norvegica]